MRVGKNTSQTASVEFCRLRQNYARSRLQAFWQKKRSFFASYFPAGLATRMTPDTCSRRRRTVDSCSLSATPTSMVMRAKPSLVLRADRFVTRVLVEERMVEMSMMRFSRSLATTSRVVR